MEQLKKMTSHRWKGKETTFRKTLNHFFPELFLGGASKRDVMF